MRKKHAQSLLLTLTLTLVLSACAMGPDYQRPSVDLPETWRLPVEDACSLADTAWWEQFNDPVLNELVATALRENLDLRIASARVDEYAARYGVSRADLLPAINAGGQAARQKNTLPDTPLKEVYSTYGATFNAQWEFDLWGKIRRQNEAARAQYLGTAEARRAVMLSLVAGVASSYLNLRSLDQQLAIARDTTKTRAVSYKLFQERFAGGVISLLELNQVKSQYDEALASLPSFEAAIAQQENALSLLLGQNPGAIKRGQDITDLTWPAITADLPATLLARRPDILAVEQDLIAANALIGAAKALYFPSISLTGLFGGASSELSNLFNEPSRIWQFSGAINLPIFNAGKIGQHVEIAKAQQQQALFNYQKTVQNAFREVNDALTGQDRTKEQLTAQKEQVDALMQYAETARLRYDNGYTSYLEVLDAERTLFSAQLQYTRTQQALLQNMIDLYKAMGGGWERQ